MTLTTASMDLKDDQARIKKTKLKTLPCPRRAHLDELITIEYKNYLDCYNILFIFFRSPFLVEGLSHYIAFFGSS